MTCLRPRFCNKGLLLQIFSIVFCLITLTTVSLRAESIDPCQDPDVVKVDQRVAVTWSLTTMGDGNYSHSYAEQFLPFSNDDKSDPRSFTDTITRSYTPPDLYCGVAPTIPTKVTFSMLALWKGSYTNLSQTLPPIPTEPENLAEASIAGPFNWSPNSVDHKGFVISGLFAPFWYAPASASLGEGSYTFNFTTRAFVQTAFGTGGSTTSDLAISAGFGANRTASFTDYVVYTVPIPEPSSMLLLGSGIIGLSTLLRRKLTPHS